MEMTLPTVFCKDGQKYSGHFKDRSTALRYVIEKKTGDRLAWRTSWDIQISASCRFLVQSPTGDVLFDQVNPQPDREAFAQITCPKDGAYSLYVLPIAVTGSFVIETEFGGNRVWSGGRRLPVLFVIDTSKTMQVDEMQSVNKALNIAEQQMNRDPCCLEACYLTCISFDSKPIVHGYFVDLMTFSYPLLNRNPHTDSDIASALSAIDFVCSTHIRTDRTPFNKPDGQTAAFIFSNFQCRHGWDYIAPRPRGRSSPFLLPCLVGQKPNTDNAKRLSDVCFHCDESATGFDEFFMSFVRFWDDDGPVESESRLIDPLRPLAPLPQHFTIVP